MLMEWYYKDEPQNRPKVYGVKSWIFLPQHENGPYILNPDS